MSEGDKLSDASALKNSIDQLSAHYRSGELAFLVGAGISADPPSTLPLAKDLCRRLLKLVAPNDPHVVSELWQRLETVRLERILSVVERSVRLSCLSILHSTRPNSNHVLLARAIENGAIVFTTNFDTLIEQARHGNWPVRRTPSELRSRTDVGMGSSSGCLVKLHGSVELLEEDGPISTIEQIVQGLPVEAAGFLSSVVAERPLVVLGYSGGDDFDLNPWFLDGPCRRGLYWLTHASGEIQPRAAGQLDDEAQRITQANNGLLLQGPTGNFLATIADDAHPRAPASMHPEAPPPPPRDEVTKAARLVSLASLARSVGLTSLAQFAYPQALIALDVPVPVSEDEDRYSPRWIHLEAVPSGDGDPERVASYSVIVSAASLERQLGNVKLAWIVLEAGLRLAKTDTPAGKHIAEVAELLVECARFAYDDSTTLLTECPYGPTHFLEQALTLCDRDGGVKARRVRVAALQERATWFRNLSKPDAALEALEQALAISESLRLRQTSASIRCSIALVLMDKREYAKAREFFQRARDWFRRANVQEAVARTGGNIGLCLARLGSADDAIFELEQAIRQLAVLRAAADFEKFHAYLWLATLHWNKRGDATASEKYLARAYQAGRLRAADGGSVTLEQLRVQNAWRQLREGRPISIDW